MDSLGSPMLVIVAGPNGSGKPTFYVNSLRSMYPQFVNADEIAKTPDPSLDQRDRVAAEQAEQEREQLLLERKTFAFETVFSRTTPWLDFIGRARAAGYCVHLHFICTENPVLNASRVEARVEAGGHAVALEKLAKRYPLSIQTAVFAKSLVDQLWLYANTAMGKSPLLVGRFVAGKLTNLIGTIPKWALPFFIDAQSA